MKLCIHSQVRHNGVVRNEYMSVYFQTHTKSCERRLLNSCPSICAPSVRPHWKKIDSNWAHFCETLFGTFIINELWKIFF